MAPGRMFMKWPTIMTLDYLSLNPSIAQTNRVLIPLTHLPPQPTKEKNYYCQGRLILSFLAMKSINALANSFQKCSLKYLGDIMMLTLTSSHLKGEGGSVSSLHNIKILQRLFLELYILLFFGHYSQEFEQIDSWVLPVEDVLVLTVVDCVRTHPIVKRNGNTQLSNCS